jgi:hypothetical protein
MEVKNGNDGKKNHAKYLKCTRKQEKKYSIEKRKPTLQENEETTSIEQEKGNCQSMRERAD